MAERAVIVQCPAELAFLPLLRQSVGILCESVMDGAEAYQLQLAISELTTNIVVHAYAGIAGGVIAFHAALDADAVTLDVFDTGVPYEATPPRLPDVDALLEGGYGLFIIQQAVDVMTHTREADERNHWHLEKRVTARAHEGGNAQWR